MNRGRQKYFFTPSISVLCIIASLLMGFTILPTGTDELRQSKPVSDSRSILTFKPWELVNALAWSPDGKWLAISAGNGIVIYQTADLRLVENLPLAALTQALAFSPDGKYLAAASRDGFLRVWGTGQSDPAGLWNPTPLWQTLAHRKGANALAYSADGAILASGGNDGMARLWQADTGKPLRAIIGGSFAVSALAFSPDATTLAVANSNVVRLRDPVNGRITGTLRAEKPLFSLSYRPDGRLLAVGDSDNHVFLWDPALAFRTGNLKYPEPVVLSSHHGLPGLARSFVWQVEFSPDGKRLASAGGDHTVRIWDVSRQVLLYTLAGHSDAVTSLAFSPDGKSLASGSLDGTVRIWDLGN